MTAIRTFTAFLIPVAIAGLVAGCGDDTEPTKSVSTSESSSLSAQAEALGCTLETPKDGGNQHVGEGEHLGIEHDAYTSDPPTSGAHFGLTARWGFYDEPLQDEYAVHNLEHGGIVAWYGGDSKRWEGLFKPQLDDEPKYVVSPREKLAEGELVLTAWNALLRCPADATDKASDDDLRQLVDEFTGTYVNVGSQDEGAIPAIVAGTRQGIDEGPGQAALPAPPKPAIDTTQER